MPVNIWELGLRHFLQEPDYVLAYAEFLTGQQPPCILPWPCAHVCQASSVQRKRGCYIALQLHLLLSITLLLPLQASGTWTMREHYSSAP